jgi:hypothetical protein
LLKSRKHLVLGLAIVLVAVITFASYEAIMLTNKDSKVVSNSNSNAGFTVRFAVTFDASGFTHSLPTEIGRGTNTSVGLAINHTRTDPITLKITGSAESWSYFGYYTQPQTYQMLAKNQMTVTEAVTGALIIIIVPENASTGTYQLTITGTNNDSKTTSDTYSFSVN